MLERILNKLRARSKRILGNQEGNLAPVIVLSLVAVLMTGAMAAGMSTSLAVSSRNMALVDASTDVSLDFAQKIEGTPIAGTSAGQKATVKSTQKGLSRQQGLVMGEDMLITGFNPDGTPKWGPSQGVDGANGVWLRQWGSE